MTGKAISMAAVLLGACAVPALSQAPTSTPTAPHTPTASATRTITPTPTPTATLGPETGPPLRVDTLAVKDVRALLPEQDELWVGTSSGLLCWLDPSGPEPALMSFDPRNSGLPDRDIRAVARTHDGKVWAATAHGLASYDGLAWEVFDVASTEDSGGQPGLLSDSVTALAVDPRWVVQGLNLLAVEIHQENGQSSDISFDLEMAGTLASGGSGVLVPRGSVWAYLDDGSNQGAAWRLPGFDDSSWLDGPAQLGYGDGDEATQVGFGPDSLNKFVTTYFRHVFDVSDPAAFASLQLLLLRDDGAVVYLNGREIARSNMPAGAITFLTPATGVVGGADESTFFASPVGPANVSEIWAGFEGILAVSHFDGLTWTPTLLSQARGTIVPDRVTDLAVDASGVLWIASRFSGGFSFDGQAVQAFGPGDNLPLNLTSVAVDLLDRVWYGPDGAAVRRMDDGPGFQTIGAGLPLSDVADIAAGPDGSVWCVPDNSANRGANATAVFFDEQSQGWQQPSVQPPASAILARTAIGPDGIAWIGSAENGTFGLADVSTGRDTLLALAQPPSPPCSNVTALALDEARRLWIGCGQGRGLARFDGSAWTRFNTGNTAGITSDFITSAAFEPPDVLWFGTSGGGVLRQQAGSFTALTTSNGLASNSIQAVAVAPDGTKWFATAGANGVSRLQGSSFTTFSTSSGLISNDVRSIAIEPGPGGGVWFAAGAGLSRFHSGAFTNIPAGSNQPGDFTDAPFPGGFRAVGVAPEGVVWAGTDSQGAVFLRDFLWHRLGTFEGLPANQVLDIGFDADGATWLSVTDNTVGGVHLVKWADGEIVTRLERTDGLPDAPGDDLLLDGRLTGKIWLGTAVGAVTLQAPPDPPVTIEPLTAEDVSCSSVTLRWSRYRGAGFAGYRVMRATGFPVGASREAGVLLAAAVLLALGAICVRRRTGRRALATAAVAGGLLGGHEVIMAGAPTGFSPIQMLSQRTDRSFTDLTAQSGEVYRYRVDVLLAGGRASLPSNEVAAFTGGIVPAIPELGFVSAGADDTRLSWPAPQTQGPCPATRFELQFSQENGPFQTLDGTLPPTAEPAFEHAPLASATGYRYRLRAHNGAGASPFSPILDVTTADAPGGKGDCRPLPPSRLAARALSATEVRLRWNDPALKFGCSQQGFNVYRLGARGAETLVARVGAGETSARDRNRRPQSQNTYIVRARRGQLLSDASGPAQVTLPRGSRRVFVPGDRATVRTGLTLASGQSARLAWVSGEVRFNTIQDFGSLVGPEGFDRVPFLVEWPDDAAVPDPLRGINDGHAGLLALVDGTPLFVGPERTVSSTLGSEVRLGVNDATLTDPAFLVNSGGFLVDVSAVP